MLWAPLSYAHEYYFSFANIEVDTVEKRIEVSLKMSAHDVEHYLVDHNFKESFENIEKGSEAHDFIKSWLRSNFYMAVNDVVLPMKMQGFEVQKDDDLYFYFSIDFVPPKKCTFTIQNTLLFDFFPAQQNRIIFTRGDFEKTASLNREDRKLNFDYAEKK